VDGEVVAGGAAVALGRDRDGPALDGDVVLAADTVPEPGVDGQGPGAGDGEVTAGEQRPVRLVGPGGERVARRVAQDVLAAVGQHQGQVRVAHHGQPRAARPGDVGRGAESG